MFGPERIWSGAGEHRVSTVKQTLSYHVSRFQQRKSEQTEQQL